MQIHIRRLPQTKPALRQRHPRSLAAWRPSVRLLRPCVDRAVLSTVFFFAPRVRSHPKWADSAATVASMSSGRMPAFSAARSMCSRGIGSSGSRYGPAPSRSRVGRMRPNSECILPSAHRPRRVPDVRRFDGPLGQQVAGGLVRPLLRQRLQRGAAGVVVVILDGPLGQQGAGGLVRPLRRQRLQRGAAGVVVSSWTARWASRSRVVWSGHFSANACSAALRGVASSSWTARWASRSRVVWSGHFAANACSAALRGGRLCPGRPAGPAGAGGLVRPLRRQRLQRGAAGSTVVVLDGPLGQQGARGLVRPLRRQRLQRGAAGVVVVILDGPLGQQGAGGLVRPLRRQRLQRGAAGVVVVILDGPLGQQGAGGLVRPLRRQRLQRGAAGSSLSSWTARWASRSRVVWSGHFSANASTRPSRDRPAVCASDSQRLSLSSAIWLSTSQPRNSARTQSRRQ